MLFWYKVKNGIGYRSFRKNADELHIKSLHYLKRQLKCILSADDLLMICMVSQLRHQSNNADDLPVKGRVKNVYKFAQQQQLSLVARLARVRVFR